MRTPEEQIRYAASITPSPRQLAWQQLEFYAFTHFGMNTFTNREWGDGTEDPVLFNPDALDADQWVAAVKSAGMKALILTCKHHDGFCLWPSAYTEHSVKNSPWKNGQGDVVREVSDACRRGGIKFGVYLSPWDRHDARYGQGKPYDDYFVSQLTELATNYGDIFCFWFDGACGEGKNGKKQIYDWERYYAVLRKLQPNAVLNVCGPDVRWCGNEAGKQSGAWFPQSCGMQNARHRNRSRRMTENFPAKLTLRTRTSAAERLSAMQENLSGIRPRWILPSEQVGFTTRRRTLMCARQTNCWTSIWMPSVRMPACC